MCLFPPRALTKATQQSTISFGQKIPTRWQKSYGHGFVRPITFISWELSLPTRTVFRCEEEWLEFLLAITAFYRFTTIGERLICLAENSRVPLQIFPTAWQRLQYLPWAKEKNLLRCAL